MESAVASPLCFTLFACALTSTQKHHYRRSSALLPSTHYCTQLHSQYVRTNKCHSESASMLVLEVIHANIKQGQHDRDGEIENSVHVCSGFDCRNDDASMGGDDSVLYSVGQQQSVQAPGGDAKFPSQDYGSGGNQHLLGWKRTRI
jgi:hypothetical protein